MSACAATAYALQVVIGSSLPAWGYWTLLAGGVTCTFGGSAIAASAAQRETVARHKAEEIATEASREAQVAMRGYLTPVAAGDTILGFVGLDAPVPGSLTDDDVNTVRLLALILSSALAITR